MDKIEIIKQFVRENTFVKEANINENTLIFKEGYIDSMGFLSLLSFIEEQFNITPMDSELIETNFESINVIADFIEKRESKAA